MTNDIQQKPQAAECKSISFGARLKAAREALGLECKDAAAQLRLNERFILMMEKEQYAEDLPVTFIRGYLRAYGKLLQLPEQEVKRAIESIKPQQTNQTASSAAVAPMPEPVTSSNYFMQFFTYVIVLTMMGLAGMWWYTNKPMPSIPESAALEPAPVIPAAPQTPPPAATPNIQQTAENNAPANAMNTIAATQNPKPIQAQSTPVPIQAPAPVTAPQQQAATQEINKPAYLRAKPVVKTEARQQVVEAEDEEDEEE